MVLKKTLRNGRQGKGGDHIGTALAVQVDDIVVGGPVLVVVVVVSHANTVAAVQKLHQIAQSPGHRVHVLGRKVQPADIYIVYVSPTSNARIGGFVWVRSSPTKFVFFTHPYYFITLERAGGRII